MNKQSILYVVFGIIAIAAWELSPVRDIVLAKLARK